MRVVDSKTGKTFFRNSRRRFDEPAGPRELTFSCYRRYPFLSRDRTRLWFLEELEGARKKWAFDLWAYVLMPEHVHVLVYPSAPDLKVGKIAGRIKEAVARKAIAYLDTYLDTHARHWLPHITVREGERTRRRFWQPGGGYDRNVVELSSVHQTIEYIHANPVRRGLVACAEDWEWSSAPWYAGIRPVRIEIDDTIPVQHGTVR